MYLLPACLRFFSMFGFCFFIIFVLFYGKWDFFMIIIYYRWVVFWFCAFDCMFDPTFNQGEIVKKKAITSKMKVLGSDACCWCIGDGISNKHTSLFPLWCLSTTYRGGISNKHASLFPLWCLSMTCGGEWLASYKPEKIHRHQKSNRPDQGLGCFFDFTI